MATTRSSFGAAEVKRNLIASAGGLYRLPRAVGQWAAMEMLLTGEPIPAERAYTLGMVSRLVRPREAFDAAMEIAQRIAAAGRLARSVEEFAALLDTEDIKEGVRAFIEKRPPNWQGR